MDEYDDCDYCPRCNKHAADCWCRTGLGPNWPEPDNDGVCLTPGRCARVSIDADPN